ncbi:hypothetical protein [Pedobacter cryoconitis]|uniref:Uncharacterized protein n=1 Tax=Pedobacter cryoconitis TaxID=188932 RepID=A0A327SS80_9SPHI|nr:hypothetical protein [Pedobacter cryoconitis]RAJ31728.1 hypothetical protein LY11_02228 [Pedobacter cryoconitis]
MDSQINADTNFQFYPEMYIFQDPPIRTDITILDLVLFIIFSVSLLTVFILVLDKWVNEEIRVLKEQLEIENEIVAIKTPEVHNKTIPLAIF